MSDAMTSKERILAAIERKDIDRIPMDYWGTKEATEKIMKGIGAKTFDEFVDILRLDKLYSPAPVYIGPPLFNRDDITGNYWGVKFKKIAYANNAGIYEEMNYHPLEACESIEEIEENYTWPDVKWFDFSGIEESCNRHSGHAIAAGYMAPFHNFNYIRGLETSLMDLAVDEDMAFYIIGKISDFLYDYHKKLFESANGKIDITEVTDDFGTQSGLMISVEMFDKYFSSHYKRFIKLAKDYGLKVFHHNDGSIMPLIPRLVDLGIDILNPIQWHLPGMDLYKLKKEFGSHICFHGGIDNQHVLPFGTVEEVAAEVRTCIDVLASDKTGYILAPCHNVQVISPVENIVTMYSTALEYGTYR